MSDFNSPLCSYCFNSLYLLIKMNIPVFLMVIYSSLKGKKRLFSSKNRYEYSNIFDINQLWYDHLSN